MNFFLPKRLFSIFSLVLQFNQLWKLLVSVPHPMVSLRSISFEIFFSQNGLHSNSLNFVSRFGNFNYSWKEKNDILQSNSLYFVSRFTVLSTLKASSLSSTSRSISFEIFSPKTTFLHFASRCTERKMICTVVKFRKQNKTKVG